MVRSCSAVNCSNRWGKTREDGKKLQFHQFPIRKPDLLKKWLIAMKRDSWKPSSSSLLCAEHFLKEDYRSISQRYLKDDAVPSVFNFPKHLQRVEKKRRIISKHPAGVDNLKNATVDSSCSDLEEATASLLELATIALAREEVSSVDNCSQQRDNISQEKNCLEAETCSQIKKKQIQSPTKVQLRRKVKLLQQKLKRREKKICNLESLLFTAKKTCGMKDDTADMLKDSFGDTPFNILIHQLQNKGSKPTARRYSSSMKEFALTLYFYSPRSYNYLRRKICLPHPAMLRSWVSSKKCYPGFMEESFTYLKDIARDATPALDCALIIDAMSIRKQSIWDRSLNKYSGYVECVGIADGQEQTLASQALVFLVVSVEKKFKVPVAYFFIDKMNADVLCELKNTCLTKLHNINIKVWSITADGLSLNVRSFQLLGCNFNGCKTIDDFRTYFPHPVSREPVHVVFDACHMLKLARNALAEMQILQSEKGEIKWDFIQGLNTLQDSLGFKFANKLNGSHINYKNKVMNVSLAAQTLSSSTADALEFLMHIKDPAFLGANATIEFIRIIDRAFDLLNSRNPFGKDYKSPLSLANLTWWENIFSETIEYLLKLKIHNVYALQSRRKMFALGLIVSMISITSVAKSLLSRKESPLKYFLTYKVSQDHIELFFSSIRSCGGYNNNPNVCQFRWALRKLLLAGNISAKNSNCFNNDILVPSILEFRSPKRSFIEPTFSDDENFVLSMYSDYLNEIDLSDYQSNILFYIGGYIVKNIIKKLTCQSCVQMLVNKNDDHNYVRKTSSDPKAFCQFVSRGGLQQCSVTVFKIVSIAEKAFRLLVLKEKQHLITNLDLKLRIITNEYLSNEGIQFVHPIENEFGFEELHESQMVKQIIDRYIKIRLKSYGDNLTVQKIHCNSATRRQRLLKLILFGNV